MIKVNDRLSFHRDSMQWILDHKRPSKTGTGPRKAKGDFKVDRTYHGTIRQVACAIIEREAGMAESMEDLLKILENAQDIVTEKIDPR